MRANGLTAHAGHMIVFSTITLLRFYNDIEYASLTEETAEQIWSSKIDILKAVMPRIKEHGVFS